MLNPKDVNAGQEQHETFKHGRRKYVQYDYRHTNGELFSCVKPNLEACRQARDAWLKGIPSNKPA
ncbi:MAG: DUF3873 family protein [Bacillota bacterium]